MNYVMDAAAEERLAHYITGIGVVLGHSKRKEAFALYTLGLFSDLERKSVEPIVALTCPDPTRVDVAAHQSLLHFVSTSIWDRPRGARLWCTLRLGCHERTSAYHHVDHR